MGSQPQKSHRSNINNAYPQSRMYSQPTLQNYQNYPSLQQSYAFNQAQPYRQTSMSQQLPIPPPQQQYQKMFSQQSTLINSTRPLVIKNEVCIEDVKLVGNEFCQVQFTVFAQTACKITIYVQCLEQINPISQVHIGIKEKLQTEVFEFEEKETMNRKITSRTQVSEAVLKQSKSSNGQKYWPLLIIIQNKETMIIYYFDYEDQKLKQTKQRFYNKSGVFDIQEIYGINDTDLVGQMKQDHNDGDCIICLSEHIDTIIMPCRHMCLCGGCAKSIMDKKAELKKQQLERQLLQQQQVHAPDYNICPVCRKEMQSFIKLNRVS